MLLNSAKFSTYTNKFNAIMNILSDFINEENERGSAERIIKNIHCRTLNDLIYNIFPKNWIIFGEFYDQYIDDSSIKYFNIRDLGFPTLRYLQTKMNQIEVMCDNSIQCFDDFIKNSSNYDSPLIYDRPGL